MKSATNYTTNTSQLRCQYTLVNPYYEMVGETHIPLPSMKHTHH